MGGSRGLWPVDVDDAYRVCVIGRGARLSGLVGRAAWCVARAGVANDRQKSQPRCCGLTSAGAQGPYRAGAIVLPKVFLWLQMKTRNAYE